MRFVGVEVRGSLAAIFGLGLLLLLSGAPAGRAQGVAFALGSYTNRPGDTLTASVTVSNFVQATTVQFTLQWDPSVLQYLNTGGYGLEGLDPSSFGTPLTNGGKLTCSWDDPNAAGVTVADGTVMFTVSFLVVGSAGSQSGLALTDAPTLREVSVDFVDVSFLSVDGQVQVVAPAAPPVIHGVAATPGNIQFTWSAVAGQNYQIQYTTNLSQGAWSNLGAAITATDSTAGASDSIGPDRQRFYRVLAQ